MTARKWIKNLVQLHLENSVRCIVNAAKYNAKRQIVPQRALHNRFPQTV